MESGTTTRTHILRPPCQGETGKTARRCETVGLIPSKGPGSQVDVNCVLCVCLCVSVCVCVCVCVCVVF